MVPYFVLLLLLLFLAFFSREARFAGKDCVKPLVGVSCILLAIMAGLRSPTVGADTSNYQNFFCWLSAVPFDQLIQADTTSWNSQGTEITYKVFNRIVALFSTNPQAITVACSAVLGLCLYILVIRQSKDPLLSILLFVCLGLFQTSLNIAPSCLAALIASIGLEFAWKKNLKMFLLCIAAGCLFHYSSLLFVPLYFMAKLTWKLNFVLIGLVVCFLIIPFAYPFLITFLSSFVPHRWMQYLSVSRVNVSQIFVWLFFATLFLLARFVSCRKVGSTKAGNLYNCMFLFVGLSYAFTLYSMSFSRVAILFAPFLIVAIPHFLSTTEDRFLNKRMALRLGTRELVCVYANHAKTLIVVIAITVFALRLAVNNIGMTQPYSLFL